MTGSSLALWRGSPNHYNGRQGYGIDHITLHIMVGTLAGTDTVFQDPAYRAASHYGVGGDGTIYQWVDEDDGGWADANMASDCSGVSIEHAGGMDGIPVTDAEIEASAQLCADIAIRHGLGLLWHDPSGNLAGNVYLHREIPGTDHATCPDLAPNGLPVDRIIARANQIIEGDDMVSEQDIETIAQRAADKVINANLNGVLLRDRIIGTDGAANAARANTARLEGMEQTLNRNDWRLFRILQSLKDFAGVPKDDTTTVPDLWKNQRLDLIDGRVYRLALTMKRLLGIDDKSTDVPEVPLLSDAQLDAIADRVAARLKAADTTVPEPTPGTGDGGGTGEEA